jgi:hypothetical protein
MGASLAHGPVTFHAATPAASEATLTLLKDGRPVAAGKGSVTRAASDPGVYRVEATYPGFAVPWIVSNPIRIGLGGRPAAPAGEPPPPPAQHVAVSAAGTAWTLEQDRSSTGAIDREGDALRFTFTLGRGALASPYAALVTTAAGDRPLERIRFTGRAGRPMRLSVQIRTPGGPDGRRWRRSVYLDPTPRVIDLALSDLEPVGPATALRPVVARVQAVLFVVDTVNAAPGATGTVWLSNVLLGLGDPQRP